MNEQAGEREQQQQQQQRKQTTSFPDHTILYHPIPSYSPFLAVASLNRHKTPSCPGPGPHTRVKL